MFGDWPSSPFLPFLFDFYVFFFGLILSLKIFIAVSGPFGESFFYFLVGDVLFLNGDEVEFYVCIYWSLRLRTFEEAVTGLGIFFSLVFSLLVLLRFVGLTDFYGELSVFLGESLLLVNSISLIFISSMLSSNFSHS